MPNHPLHATHGAQPTVEAPRTFEAVRLELRAEFGESEFRSYLAHLSCLGVMEDALVLMADNAVMRDWVARRALHRIQARMAAHGWLGDVRVLTPQETPPTLRARAVAAPAPADGATDGTAPAALGLCPDYTFDTFVQGRSNHRAFTIAQMVATGAGMGFPLVLIHGAPGYGKTHLLNAVAHEAMRAQPHRKVRYMMAQEFVEEFQAALHKKRDATGFKAMVREPDLLLIDDVQRFIGKRATEEEFFDTIAMVRAKGGGQVMITADHGPDGLGGFAERLREQLKAATACEITEPDQAMRRAILDMCVRRYRRGNPSFSVAPAALDMIAEHLVAGGRMLDGAVAELVLEAQILGGEVTLDVAQEALRGKIATHVELRRITVQHVARTVAAAHGMSLAEMLERTRRQAVVRPRQVAMYLACKMTHVSLPDLGRRFSPDERAYDHTTVMYARDAVEKRLQEDPKLRQAVDALEREIRRTA